MDGFKKNTRSYRLIASLNKNDAMLNNSLQETSVDFTSNAAVNWTQNKYSQLHNEITKENQATYYNILPEVEPKEDNRQTVLLDISNSINLSNMITENEENISICAEVDDAYRNLIQIEDNELDSRYLDSLEFNATINEIQEHNSTLNKNQEHEPQDENTSNFECDVQNKVHVTKNDFSEYSVNVSNLNSSPSLLFTNSAVPQVNVYTFESPPQTTSGICNPDEGVLHNSTISEPKIDENRTGRPKKGRKRKYPHQTRDIRKNLCETNKQYINQKGKLVNSREFIDFRCNDSCHEKISMAEREEEFLKFWELSFEGKCLYISSNVKVIGIKRKRNKVSNKRKNTRIYSLKNKVVCAKMFINTLNISSARIDRYLKKSSGSNKIEDKRGKVTENTLKITQDVETAIIEHIDKFPKYKSHYCRAQTERMYEYLPPDMTLSKMYDLYVSEVSLIKRVSFSTYKKIFYTKFNLQRKKPQKDTCNKCDLLAIKIRDTTSQEIKLNLEKEREQHHKEAENARALKKQDMTLAKTCDHIEALTFDMEKTLPLPRIPTNIVFYKRQLWLYNCGIHSGKTSKGFCYVWVDGTAGRGAQEVGSALRKHLSLNLDSKVKELVLWSDSCESQNRNIKLTLLLFAMLEENENLEKITLRFMVPGHSFLENDSDFSDIESALKTHTRLYTPQDYMDVMISCRKRNKLTAIKMEKNDFVGVSKIMKKIVNRKKYIEGHAVSWLKTKEINIYKDKPGQIFLSTTHGGFPQEVDLNKRPKRGTQNIPLHFSGLYEQLWPKGKLISQPKLDDIKSLLHLIPSDARQYYENLTGSRDLEEDVEGFNGSIDFDIEEED